MLVLIIILQGVLVVLLVMDYRVKLSRMKRERDYYKKLLSFAERKVNKENYKRFWEGFCVGKRIQKKGGR